MCEGGDVDIMVSIYFKFMFCVGYSSAYGPTVSAERRRGYLSRGK